MTLHTLSIPDDPAELPRWLERRLVAPDYRDFVAELLAFFPAAKRAAPPAIDEWLPTALTDGLEAIPSDILSELLRQPAALDAFRGRIVAEGGVYWDDVLARADGTAGVVARGRSALDHILKAPAPPSKVKGKPTTKEVPKGESVVVPSTGRRPASRWTKAWAVASTGIAACLAVGLGYTLLIGKDERPIQKSQVAWGWAKPGGLAADQRKPGDYLNKLASNAEEWSLDRPSGAEGVATRLAEFRLGCSRLMHSQYGSLSPDDKAWLLEHCRTWGRELDEHQRALDAGGDPVAIRTAVDETVRTIAVTLRERAKQIG